ncbi:peptidoglycan D,D-transpeptidase FtsI family protein, partial [Treponema sp. R6D11]
MTNESNLKIRKAMTGFCIAFFVLFAILILRLFCLQVVKGSWYSEQALEQQTKDRVIASKRGKILDRAGQVLAESISAEAVSVTPNQIIENKKHGITADMIAEKLAGVLDLDKDAVYKKLTKSSYYEIIKRKVDKNETDQIRRYITDNKIVGIKIDEDTKRYYPNGSSASQVIGFVGTDNDGLEGIEAILNFDLKGTAGRVISAQNVSGVDMPFDYEKLIAPENGVNAVLTIDENIQHFVENHLSTAYVDNHLEQGASCIVMDVKTGEILAMATMPTYDLNKPFEITDSSFLQSISALPALEQKIKKNEYLTKLRRNKGVVDTYEPGSVFKIFTSAMALEENVVKLDDTFSCGGSVQVADRRIKCWKSAGHGHQTFVDGVKNSCNPVFIELGRRIGGENFYKYFKGFGFTEKTGIEILGEAVGMHYKEYTELDLAVASFGQSNNVTPIQMIAGVSAIANGGKYMKPHILKKTVDDDGNVISEKQPEMLRQIVSKQTSDTLKDILEKVVSDGTGSNAYVAGYRVAGKTGTSEKQPRGQAKYIASFAGFAPADDPKIACIVILDQPARGRV